MKTIEVNELKEKLQKGTPCRLIDVRTGPEYGEAHIAGAVNIPLDQLGDFQHQAGEELILVCKSGTRARTACQLLEKKNLQALVVDGGLDQWIKSGNDVQRGTSKVISLERQVRIAAGAMALGGAALSFVHPYFIGIPMFVGAGLMFAGITDTCGMAIILSRMPWNRTSATGTACKIPATGTACKLKPR